MKKGKIGIILIIVLILIIAGFSIFELTIRKRPKPFFNQYFPNSENFSETKEYEDFSEECNNNGGGVVLEEEGDIVKCSCYVISRDSEEGCSGDYECVYDCNFSNAISSGICVLVKTDKDLGKGIYTYEYECSEEKPGFCSNIPIIEPEWEMFGSKLIEIGHKEFPQEEEEFSPV